VTITSIDAEPESGDDLDAVGTDTGEPKTSSEPESSDSGESSTVGPSSGGGKEAARDGSLAKLEGQSPPPPKPSPLLKELLGKAISPAQAKIRRRPSNGPDAVIVLKEERATIFHDFLKFVYPQ
jgi:hypothetical protein